MIKTENLSKYFGETAAVKNLDLDIRDGEIFAFIGPNGAGKSTTIKILVGLLSPSGGRALIGGHDIQQDPLAAQRLIGYIPDFPYLYEKLTGLEFLRFIGNIYNLDGGELPRRIDYYLDLFGLNELAPQLIENYSHGYRQRLVFASAFLHDPKVLIIDEPMVGLDPKSGRLIKELLRERSLRGDTVFISTHTLSIAEEVADRVGIIHEGELIACGNLDQLRKQSGIKGRLEEVFLKITAETETHGKVN